MFATVVISIVIFAMIILNLASLGVLLILSLFLIFFVIILSEYFIGYDEETKTDGLTVWSLNKTKEYFKGGKVNDAEGKSVMVSWKIKDGDDDSINFSKSDMAKMKANIHDLVYLCDKRMWLGGLKSIHSVFGEPHDEDGIVYATNDHIEQGQFIKGKLLIAEKEM